MVIVISAPVAWFYVLDVVFLTITYEPNDPSFEPSPDETDDEAYDRILFTLKIDKS